LCRETGMKYGLLIFVMQSTTWGRPYGRVQRRTHVNLPVATIQSSNEKTPARFQLTKLLSIAPHPSRLRRATFPKGEGKNYANNKYKNAARRFFIQRVVGGFR